MSRTVLVVEDHDANRQMIGMLVEMEGHRVLQAATIAQARAQLEQEVPDVVLMDVDLPDGDGIDFTAELRRENRFDGMRIYAVTAFVMGETRQRAERAGCDGFFEKPIDTAKLLPALVD